MKRSTEHTFSALRIEGGILPPEFLQRIASFEAGRQEGRTYAVSKALTLKDEIGRYWRIAVSEWQDFQERRKRADLRPEQVGVQDWLLPLLIDVLGFRDITPASQKAVLNERSYPITHRAWGGSVPLVLTTCGFDLDRADGRFGDDGRRRAPHALIQEFLNADQDVVWGLVSNGLKLRLVRDNPSLTRPAYIEADLERMFEEQLFADFAAFWLTFHASRVEPHDGKASACILEGWRQEGHKTGERALAKLREGVTEALRELGSGFVQHPANEGLREQIRTGDLTQEAFFQELLRLVYRLLFLFTAEDRNLLLDPRANGKSCQRYIDGYALSRLRDRSRLRRHYDAHDDLWRGLQITFQGLARGAEPLGLPALGGLFATSQCATLDRSLIANASLLRSIYALAFFQTDGVLARVNYRDMGVEELGSVYESLLELHPFFDVELSPWRFGFVGDNTGESAKGSERKLSGSYYTPDALVQELIKSALEPVITERLRMYRESPREALLRMRILDPACGSGHFLLAAARRLAAEIARLDAVADVPDEALRRHAMREVVQHCIYGVDRNPLAVELCKTALWIETLEPGKPLTFLDPHILCGDSLVGVFDMAALQEGIPDDAYKGLTGDGKAACRDLKKRNRDANRGMRAVQTSMFDVAVAASPAGASIDLDTMPEDTLEQVEAKARAFAGRAIDPALCRSAFMADLYVGAFFARKTQDEMLNVPVTEDLNRVHRNIPVRPGVAETVRELANCFRFLHWPLAFPEAMAAGGFDVVLGNPPWERIKLQEQEFFSARSKVIANAGTKAERGRLISALGRPDATPAERALYTAFEHAKREAEAISLFARHSGRFPLTAVGDLNTYALFGELFVHLFKESGRAGALLPQGIATDDGTKTFFSAILQNHQLVSLIGMGEVRGWFPATDDRKSFCLITLGKNIDVPEFTFNVKTLDELYRPERRIRLAAHDFTLLNPNTRTCPIFRTSADAELTKIIYRRVPVLINEGSGENGNPWGIRFMRMFDMANDSGLFCTRSALVAAGARPEGVNWIMPDGTVQVPLLEAKMIHHYDHRWATYENGSEKTRDVRAEEKTDSTYRTQPRYWVPLVEVEARLRAKEWPYDWLLGWRDVTKSEDLRTLICGVAPFAGYGHKFLLFMPKRMPSLMAALLANLSSLVLDYVARQKLGGNSFNYSVFKQVPVLSPDKYDERDLSFIVPRVLELAYNAEDIRPFARDLGHDGPPFRWDMERRALLRAELDAYFAHKYGLTRQQLCYILDPSEVYGPDFPSETFRVLKAVEKREFHEYRTARFVTQAWDRFEQDGTFREDAASQANMGLPHAYVTI